MNPVLILTRNNLELTKRCVESVRGQDIDTSVAIGDNGSTDGTVDWLRSWPEHSWWAWERNIGVSEGWNIGLRHEFAKGSTHVLVLNNDAIIPPWFYRRLLNHDQPFITGVAVDYPPKSPSPHCPLTPNPDFSAFLIRRDAWERIGVFDESMVIYCSDCDYHIRGHQLGVPMLKANVPYYHINSQTLKRADPADRTAIEAQANKDREVFRQKWGCLPGTPEYASLFK